MAEFDSVNILALDLATKTGWATCVGSVVESGVQAFSVKRGESRGMRYYRFMRWLEEMALVPFGTCDRESLAWAAGFFDGEGHTGCTPAYTKDHVKADGSVATYRSDSIHLQITQASSPELLEKFREAVGGLGNINGPYDDKRGGDRSPTWMYRVGSVEKARHIIHLMWPWLGSVKRDQARAALELKLSRMGKLPRDTREPGLIVYEAPHHRGGAATELLAGFSTRVQEFASRHGFEYQSVHSGTLKKFAVGKGNAGKAEMIEAAKARWPDQHIEDDNQADALWILAWGMNELGVKE